MKTNLLKKKFFNFKNQHFYIKKKKITMATTFIENSNFKKLEIIVPRKRSISTSFNRNSSVGKLPPITDSNLQHPLKTRKLSSSNEIQIMKILTSDALQIPKTELKEKINSLNNYDIKQCNLSPSMYRTDFELNLMDDCKKKYEKIMKELNEVRS